METRLQRYSKGYFGTAGKPPEIPDSRITRVKGWFQQTLPKFLETFRPGSQLIINNDSDLYSSTLYTLTVLDHFLVPGTIIIFDEFRAYKEYTSAYMRKLCTKCCECHFDSGVFEDEFVLRAVFQTQRGSPCAGCELILVSRRRKLHAVNFSNGAAIAIVVKGRYSTRCQIPRCSGSCMRSLRKA